MGWRCDRDRCVCVPLAQATTKERMLQLRQENQRLRKSVPIDFGERKEEEGAKISLFNLLDDLKKKQPQKYVLLPRRTLSLACCPER